MLSSLSLPTKITSLANSGANSILSGPDVLFDAAMASRSEMPSRPGLAISVSTVVVSPFAASDAVVTTMTRGGGPGVGEGTGEGKGAGVCVAIGAVVLVGVAVAVGVGAGVGVDAGVAWAVEASSATWVTVVSSSDCKGPQPTNKKLTNRHISSDLILFIRTPVSR